MKNLMKRAKYVLMGEEGASNIEIIVWISVVLVIAGFLFLFRNAITGFITKATNSVSGLQINANN